MDKKINEGETIGHMGDTGISTGSHLHFEIRDCSYIKFWEREASGKYVHAVDPQPLLNKIKIKTDREKVQEYFGFDNNTMVFLDKHHILKICLGSCLRIINNKLRPRLNSRFYYVF